MIIGLVGAEYFHADGRTDKRTDKRRCRRDEAKSRFRNFANAPIIPLVKMACLVMQHSDISNNVFNFLFLINIIKYE